MLCWNNKIEEAKEYSQFEVCKGLKDPSGASPRTELRIHYDAYPLALFIRSVLGDKLGRTMIIGGDCCLHLHLGHKIPSGCVDVFPTSPLTSVDDSIEGHHNIVGVESMKDRVEVLVQCSHDVVSREHNYMLGTYIDQYPQTVKFIFHLTPKIDLTCNIIDCLRMYYDGECIQCDSLCLEALRSKQIKYCSDQDTSLILKYAKAGFNIVNLPVCPEKTPEIMSSLCRIIISFFNMYKYSSVMMIDSLAPKFIASSARGILIDKTRDIIEVHSKIISYLGIQNEFSLESIRFENERIIAVISDLLDEDAYLPDNIRSGYGDLKLGTEQQIVARILELIDIPMSDSDRLLMLSNTGIAYCK